MDGEPRIEAAWLDADNYSVEFFDDFTELRRLSAIRPKRSMDLVEIDRQFDDDIRKRTKELERIQGGDDEIVQRGLEKGRTLCAELRAALDKRFAVSDPKQAIATMLRPLKNILAEIGNINVQKSLIEEEILVLVNSLLRPEERGAIGSTMYRDHCLRILEQLTGSEVIDIPTLLQSGLTQTLGAIEHHPHVAEKHKQMARKILKQWNAMYEDDDADETLDEEIPVSGPRSGIHFASVTNRHMLMRKNRRGGL
ncbi:IWS1-like protein [Carpediemonas membranifera]|uniref:IWS1-like protein n=1 Tax=Carpediemonas membranifera TaxID=201153 RepID=A0A8J6AUK1_9EUKA|nr:IWS1-like protein [Carpediemonas membranifera]|eukprot:KAG9391950.1 IWS1-like protein [Carpediemonas membranifera]